MRQGLDASRAKRAILADLTPRVDAVRRDVERQIEGRCPVDTGYMRSRISSELTVGGDAVGFTQRVGTAYAVWVDGGTRTQPPTHFVSGTYYDLMATMGRRLKGAT